MPKAAAAKTAAAPAKKNVTRKPAPKAAVLKTVKPKTVEVKPLAAAKPAAAKKPAPRRPAAIKVPGKVTKTAERKAKKAVKAVETGKTPEKAAAALKAPVAPKAPRKKGYEALLKSVLAQLDDDKAEEIVTIDLEGKADYADVIVIASGRSSRHVASVADHLAERVKADGFGRVIVEGEKAGDWAVIDCGDIVVHLFRPEVRAFYDLESMWAGAKA
jgi:ribosome-associated protein